MAELERLEIPDAVIWVRTDSRAGWDPPPRLSNEFIGEQVFKRSARLLVGRARDRHGRTWTLKLRSARGVLDRTKMRLRVSQGFRQAYGARLLTRAGLRASVPVAIGRAGGRHAPIREVVVLPFVEGPSLLECVIAEGLTAASPLLVRAARDIGDVARQGIYNRDPKPSNLIINTSGALHWIDTVGVRPTAAPRRSLERMLASVVVELLGYRIAVSEEFVGELCRAALEQLHSREATPAEVDSVALRVARRVSAFVDPRPLDPLWFAQPTGGSRSDGRR